MHRRGEVRQTTSRLGEPGRRTGCQDSGGVGLAGRAGGRMSESELERGEAAWEEQRGVRILIDEQSSEGAPNRIERAKSQRGCAPATILQLSGDCYPLSQKIGRYVGTSVSSLTRNLNQKSKG